MAAVHIPAWQKLGLKLKNQLSIPSSPLPSSPANAIHAGRTPLRRKFSPDREDSIDSPSLPKRLKIKAETNGNNTTNGILESSPERELQDGDHRRKSVTFAADTKEEDGYSSKRLHEAVYASRRARISGVESEDFTAAGQLEEALKPIINGKNSARKQASTAETTNGHQPGDKITEAPGTKIKQKKKPSSQPSSKVETARQKKKSEQVIAYLQEYTTSRAIWKFNKSRQISLLKMIFDLKLLPTEHDQDLSAYIKGLQGAGMRRKLKEQAEDVLIHDDNEEGIVARARLIRDALGNVDVEMEHEHGLEQESEPEPTNGQDVEERERSIDTQHTKPNGVLSNGANSLRPPVMTISPLTETTQKKKRTRRLKTKKKKRRTASYSDSESSSSSSSDSESHN